MKDRQGTIIYVGKALSLASRVRSYFSKSGLSHKTQALMKHVDQVDYIETPTEVEALLLEAQLIRQHLPHYNIQMRDDKSYPFLEITNEEFPQVRITRAKKNKGSIYYGPYTDATLLKVALRMIHEIFPIRKCRTICKTLCLYNHLGQCLAPKVLPENREAYQKTIENVKSFLEGKKAGVIEYLSGKMHQAARAHQFEEAETYKNQIQALTDLKAKKYLIGKKLRISLVASLELKRALGLKKLPERIVCFDVSNTAGTSAVASRVGFLREVPEKNAYRRYQIHNVFQINDYAMIQEALSRMCQGLKEQRETFMPDLIMIDGGLGHLHAAQQVLEKENYDHIPVVAIAKRFEHLFVPAKNEPVILPERSSALHLVKKIRDEAHRFAISYHRKLRGKKLTESVLDQIEGIGERRKRQLLKHFPSIEALRQARLEDLVGVEGINRALAEEILSYLGEHKEL
jgi:excinuclease ABC subunit C